MYAIAEIVTGLTSKMNFNALDGNDSIQTYDSRSPMKRCTRHTHWVLPMMHCLQSIAMEFDLKQWAPNTAATGCVSLLADAEAVIAPHRYWFSVQLTDYILPLR